MPHKLLKIAMAASCVTLLASAAHAADPLLQSSDLVYQGAFRVPQGDYGSPQYTGFSYGGRALAYNPAKNSLFMVGHIDYQLTGEISIPTPVVGSSLGSLNTASMLQNFSDITQGHRLNLGAGGASLNLNGNYIGGLLVNGSKLIGTVYGYYDGANQAVLSHFTSSTNLSSPGFAGMYQVGDSSSRPDAGFVDGYLASVPSAYQSALGGPAMTGQSFIPIVSRTSYGPAAFAFDPARLGVDNPVAANPLVYYPINNPTLGSWGSSRQDQYVSTADTMGGLVFPTSTASVLFFGKHGTGVSCYGPATDNASQGKTNAWLRANSPGGWTCGWDTMTASEISSGDSCCYDPPNVGGKGTHSYPYSYFVWAYNVNDLIAVKNKTKNPWDIAPYAGWSLDANLTPYGSGGDIYGAAYDPATQRIFVSQASADPGGFPLIHVYKVNAAASTADTSAPTASFTYPASGATVSGTVSVTASASDNVGVSKVELYVNGTLTATDTTTPYTFSWNTTSRANGSYTLSLKAYDAAGNVGTASRTVTVSNVSDSTAPTVAISSPANNATVQSTVGVSASASDNVGVSRVDFYVNGSMIASSNTAPYAFNLNTANYANGAITVAAKAYDAAGNMGQSATNTLNVSNGTTTTDTSAPSVGTFTMPTSATTLSVPVSAFSATDNVRVTGYLITESSTRPSAGATGWSTSAPTSFTFAGSGARTAYAWAKDAAGNVSASRSASVTITLSTTTQTIATDKTVYRDVATAGSSITTPTITTAAGKELLVAFITGSAPASGTNTTVTSVTNTGTALTWTKAVASNAQRGFSEIWWAYATTPISGTVTATLNQSVSSRSITVMSFTGTAAGSAAIGAVGGTSSAYAAPTANVTTTKANSLIFATGNDYTSPIARTLGSGQSMTHQFLSPTSDTYWVQRRTNAVSTAGSTVSIGTTAPTGDATNLSYLEIRAM